MCRHPPGFRRFFGRLENATPARDHRQAVGNHHMVERLDAEQGLRIERCSIAMCDADLTVETSTLDCRDCGRQHFRRNIDTEKSRVRIKPGGEHKVSAGSAPYFQHACAGGRLQAGDQTIPAEQAISPCAIVDVALPAVHPVHSARRFDRPRGIRADISGIRRHPSTSYRLQSFTSCNVRTTGV